MSALDRSIAAIREVRADADGPVSGGIEGVLKRGFETTYPDWFDEALLNAASTAELEQLCMMARVKLGLSPTLSGLVRRRERLEAELAGALEGGL
ncbi:MAG: hypothetical protein AAGM84_05495 [Pseudomonadota bacterium]